VRAGTPGCLREGHFTSTAPELCWTLDDAGCFLRIDGPWQAVVGWEPSELRGCRWEMLVHPADRARVAEAFLRLRAPGAREEEIEMRVTMPTGGHRRVTFSLAAGPNPECIIAIGRDGVEDRDADVDGRIPSAVLEDRNRELLARLEALEERYAAVERFAATAAHQLAEPLIIAESSAILVADELGEDLDPAMRERLDAIGRGAARARRLMDALLADARSAALPLSLEPVDLAAAVRDTLTAFAPRIEETRTAVKVSDLPQVRSDRALLCVVLDNLVSNALKHGPRHGGTITISAERSSGGWRLLVTSNGPPIAEEDLPRIFEPYVRLPRERRASGSGLGLAICARLVRRMGSELAVDPAGDRGNTFHLVLPGT
jgi:PAS domain S-box-containing protein